MTNESGIIWWAMRLMIHNYELSALSAGYDDLPAVSAFAPHPWTDSKTGEITFKFETKGKQIVIGNITKQSFSNMTDDEWDKSKTTK